MTRTLSDKARAIAERVHRQFDWYDADRDELEAEIEAALLSERQETEQRVWEEAAQMIEEYRQSEPEYCSSPPLERRAAETGLPPEIEKAVEQFTRGFSRDYQEAIATLAAPERRGEGLVSRLRMPLDTGLGDGARDRLMRANRERKEAANALEAKERESVELKKLAASGSEMLAACNRTELTLRSQIKQLRGALEKITHLATMPDHKQNTAKLIMAHDIARAALETDNGK